MSWRVLVVDDDVTVGMTISLADAGIEVIDASRIGDALTMVQREHFDAVICDRRMPDGDGLTFLKLLRTERRSALLPVIVLTASFDEAHRAEVMAAGATSYLGKPIEPSTLVAAIADVIDKPIGSPVAAQPHFRPRETPVLDPVVEARADAGDLRDALQRANAKLAEAVVDVNKLRRAVNEHEAARAQLVAERDALRAKLTASVDDASRVADENTHLATENAHFATRVEELQAYADELTVYADKLEAELTAERDVSLGESAKRLAKGVMGRTRRVMR
jgi:DNA-binding response OmpR family regulator